MYKSQISVLALMVAIGCQSNEPKTPNVTVIVPEQPAPVVEVTVEVPEHTHEDTDEPTDTGLPYEDPELTVAFTTAWSAAVPFAVDAGATDVNFGAVMLTNHGQRPITVGQLDLQLRHNEDPHTLGSSYTQPGAGDDRFVINCRLDDVFTQDVYGTTEPLTYGSTVFTDDFDVAPVSTLAANILCDMENITPPNDIGFAFDIGFVTAQDDVGTPANVLYSNVNGHYNPSLAVILTGEPEEPEPVPEPTLQIGWSDVTAIPGPQIIQPGDTDVLLGSITFMPSEAMWVDEIGIQWYSDDTPEVLGSFYTLWADTLSKPEDHWENCTLTTHDGTVVAGPEDVTPTGHVFTDWIFMDPSDPTIGVPILRLWCDHNGTVPTTPYAGFAGDFTYTSQVEAETVNGTPVQVSIGNQNGGISPSMSVLVEGTPVPQDPYACVDPEVEIFSDFSMEHATRSSYTRVASTVFATESQAVRVKQLAYTLIGGDETFTALDGVPAAEDYILFCEITQENGVAVSDIESPDLNGRIEFDVDGIISGASVEALELWCQFANLAPVGGDRDQWAAVVTDVNDVEMEMASSGDTLLPGDYCFPFGLPNDEEVGTVILYNNGQVQMAWNGPLANSVAAGTANVPMLDLWMTSSLEDIVVDEARLTFTGDVQIVEQVAISYLDQNGIGESHASFPQPDGTVTFLGLNLTLEDDGWWQDVSIDIDVAPTAVSGESVLVTFEAVDNEWIGVDSGQRIPLADITPGAGIVSDLLTVQ